jgi:hypothetical protein
MDWNSVLEIFIISEETLRFGGALVALMLANILLGSAQSLFDHEFDWKRMVKGVAKAIVVVLGYYFVVVAGNLIPNFVAIDIGGELVGILVVVNISIIAGIYFYTKQVFDKLLIYVNGKAESRELTLEEMYPDYMVADYNYYPYAQDGQEFEEIDK